MPNISLFTDRIHRQINVQKDGQGWVTKYDIRSSHQLTIQSKLILSVMAAGLTWGVGKRLCWRWPARWGATILAIPVTGRSSRYIEKGVHVCKATGDDLKPGVQLSWDLSRATKSELNDFVANGFEFDRVQASITTSPPPTPPPVRMWGAFAREVQTWLKQPESCLDQSFSSQRYDSVKAIYEKMLSHAVSTGEFDRNGVPQDINRTNLYGFLVLSQRLRDTTGFDQFDLDEVEGQINGFDGSSWDDEAIKAVFKKTQWSEIEALLMPQEG